MLQPSSVHSVKAEYAASAAEQSQSLPFRGVVFEADGSHDPRPMDLLRDLSQREKRHCKVVLWKSDLNTDLASLYSVVFDVVLDAGRERKIGARPKPSPEAVQRCLADLDIDPRQAVALVTTMQGARACHAANFGVVVASAADSLEKEDDFRAAGVDVVLTTDRPLTLWQLCVFYSAQINDSGWQLRYHMYNARNEKLRETLTGVGNGYIGVRGSAEWAQAGRDCYPGCYIAGVYNCAVSQVRGVEVLNSDLVNCPNWTLVRLRIGDGGWVNPWEERILEYSHGVNMSTAQTERAVLFEDGEGRRTRLVTARFASMADMHQCALTYTVTPINYSAPLTVWSGIDGDVRNLGVERYRQLSSRHLRVVRAGASGGAVFLTAATTGVRGAVEVCVAARHVALADGRPADPPRRIDAGAKQVAEVFGFDGRQGTAYCVEKFVGVATSRDPAAPGGRAAPPGDVALRLTRAPRSYQQLAATHRIKWRQLWDSMDIGLDGDRLTQTLQKMTRLHLYHIFSSCSPNNLHLDAGLTARGLTGENHRGHTFWDEAFVFPVLTSTHPAVAKAHLLYRCNRLGASRRFAAEHGHTGAMVPWQTSDTGGEDTQIVKFNPVSQQWDPDMSRRQRHVGVAVFLNGWRYFEATRDAAFLAGDLGALMLEIARFFAGVARFDAGDGRCHIAGVMGPDEYHEQVGCPGGGVVDNAYTNVMVVWLLTRALDIARGTLLHAAARDALVRRVRLTADELAHWERVTKTMAVHITKDGVIEEFQGWMGLADLDWAAYAKKYGNLQRLDRILKAEGKRPDDFKIVKQPDTLMLFYFLSPEEVGRILARLGYPCDAYECLRRNYDYYVPLTTAGSALAFTVHARLASLLRRRGAQAAWMLESVNGDVFGQRSADGAPSEGAHLGVMAGTVDFIVAKVLGLREVAPGTFHLAPDLLPGCTRARLNRLLNGRWYHFEVTRRSVSVSAAGSADWAEGGGRGAVFRIGGNTLRPGAWRPAELQYRAITELREFYAVMRRTRVVRADVLRRVFTGRRILREQLIALRHSRDAIASLPAPSDGTGDGERGVWRVLDVDGRPQFAADLAPELAELDRDLRYLRGGEEGFLSSVMRAAHADWDAVVGACRDWVLGALGGRTAFANLVTSRNGTVMREQPRHLSHVQPAYGSVFLSRFARRCCARATILSSLSLGGEASDRGEPVEANGVWDMSVNPPGVFAYAGSHGRAYLTTQEVRGGLPLDPAHNAALQAFSTRLGELLRAPAFRKFKAFGRGMQTRWGLVAVPKADPAVRLGLPEVDRLRRAVRDIAAGADPSGKVLQVVDTGADFEVSVRPPGTRDGEWTKAKGIEFLDSALHLELAKGPNLVCCDEESDLPMVDVALRKCADTYLVYVTADAAVAAKVRARYPRSTVVPTPDHLLGALNEAAKARGADEQVRPPPPAAML